MELAQHPHATHDEQYVLSHEYAADGRWYILGEWAAKNRYGDEEPYMLVGRWTPTREEKFVRWNPVRTIWEPVEKMTLLPKLAQTICRLNDVPECL